MSNNRKRQLRRETRLRNKLSRKHVRDMRLAKKQAWQRGHLRKRKAVTLLSTINPALQALGAGLFNTYDRQSLTRASNR